GQAFNFFSFGLTNVSCFEQGFCSAPWIPYNGHCFHLQRNAQTWSGAQKACRAEGGDLATIRNVEDQSFVISHTIQTMPLLWIGLNDIRTEGLFDWSDHSHVSFTSWEYGKPGVSTDGDNCVLIRGEVHFLFLLVKFQISVQKTCHLI
uniref:C-type lectin domain-containing protein n=1 Tax=Neolamprologus brichardi TaxID=32507 RepID=A0A3Q4H2H0_NEOBR